MKYGSKTKNRTYLRNRNIRQKSNDELRKIGKEGVSEDIIRDAQESVQSITNEYTDKIDNIFSSKESDIMQV
jgi:ribosome recycling factor